MADAGGVCDTWTTAEAEGNAEFARWVQGSGCGNGTRRQHPDVKVYPVGGAPVGGTTNWIHGGRELHDNTYLVHVPAVFDESIDWGGAPALERRPLTDVILRLSRDRVDVSNVTATQRPDGIFTVGELLREFDGSVSPSTLPQPLAGGVTDDDSSSSGGSSSGSRSSLSSRGSADHDGSWHVAGDRRRGMRAASSSVYGCGGVSVGGTDLRDYWLDGAPRNPVRLQSPLPGYRWVWHRVKMAAVMVRAVVSADSATVRTMQECADAMARYLVRSRLGERPLNPRDVEMYTRFAQDESERTRVVLELMESNVRAFLTPAHAAAGGGAVAQRVTDADEQVVTALGSGLADVATGSAESFLAFLKVISNPVEGGEGGALGIWGALRELAQDEALKLPKHYFGLEPGKRGGPMSYVLAALAAWSRVGERTADVPPPRGRVVAKNAELFASLRASAYAAAPALSTANGGRMGTVAWVDVAEALTGVEAESEVNRALRAYAISVVEADMKMKTAFELDPTDAELRHTIAARVVDEIVADVAASGFDTSKVDLLNKPRQAKLGLRERLLCLCLELRADDADLHANSWLVVALGKACRADRVARRPAGWNKSWINSPPPKTGGEEARASPGRSRGGQRGGRGGQRGGRGNGGRGRGRGAAASARGGGNGQRPAWGAAAKQNVNGKGGANTRRGGQAGAPATGAQAQPETRGAGSANGMQRNTGGARNLIDGAGAVIMEVLAGAGKDHGGAGVCYDFQKGECTRGDSCRFSHTEGGGGGGAPPPPPPHETMPAASPKGSAAKRHGNKDSRNGNGQLAISPDSGGQAGATLTTVEGAAQVPATPAARLMAATRAAIKPWRDAGGRHLAPDYELCELDVVHRQVRLQLLTPDGEPELSADVRSRLDTEDVLAALAALPFDEDWILGQGFENEKAKVFFRVTCKAEEGAVLLRALCPPTLSSKGARGGSGAFRMVLAEQNQFGLSTVQISLLTSNAGEATTEAIVSAAWQAIAVNCDSDGAHERPGAPPRLQCTAGRHHNTWSLLAVLPDLEVSRSLRVYCQGMTLVVKVHAGTRHTHTHFADHNEQWDGLAGSPRHQLATRLGVGGSTVLKCRVLVADTPIGAASDSTKLVAWDCTIVGAIELLSAVRDFRSHGKRQILHRWEMLFNNISSATGQKSSDGKSHTHVTHRLTLRAILVSMGVDVPGNAAIPALWLQVTRLQAELIIAGILEEAAGLESWGFGDSMAARTRGKMVRVAGRMASEHKSWTPAVRDALGLEPLPTTEEVQATAEAAAVQKKAQTASAAKAKASAKSKAAASAALPKPTSSKALQAERAEGRRLAAERAETRITDILNATAEHQRVYPGTQLRPAATPEQLRVLMSTVCQLHLNTAVDMAASGVVSAHVMTVEAVMGAARKLLSTTGMRLAARGGKVVIARLPCIEELVDWASGEISIVPVPGRAARTPMGSLRDPASITRSPSAVPAVAFAPPTFQGMENFGKHAPLTALAIRQPAGAARSTDVPGAGRRLLLEAAAVPTPTGATLGAIQHTTARPAQGQESGMTDLTVHVTALREVANLLQLHAGEGAPLTMQLPPTEASSLLGFGHPCQLGPLTTAVVSANSTISILTLLGALRIGFAAARRAGEGESLDMAFHSLYAALARFSCAALAKAGSDENGLAEAAGREFDRTSGEPIRIGTTNGNLRGMATRAAGRIMLKLSLLLESQPVAFMVFMRAAVWQRLQAALPHSDPARAARYEECGLSNHDASLEALPAQLRELHAMLKARGEWGNAAAELVLLAVAYCCRASIEVFDCVRGMDNAYYHTVGRYVFPASNLVLRLVRQDAADGHANVRFAPAKAFAQLSVDEVEPADNSDGWDALPSAIVPHLNTQDGGGRGGGRGRGRGGGRGGSRGGRAATAHHGTPGVEEVASAGADAGGVTYTAAQQQQLVAAAGKDVDIDGYIRGIEAAVWIKNSEFAPSVRRQEGGRPLYTANNQPASDTNLGMNDWPQLESLLNAETKALIKGARLVGFCDGAAPKRTRNCTTSPCATAGCWFAFGSISSDGRPAALHEHEYTRLWSTSQFVRGSLPDSPTILRPTADNVEAELWSTTLLLEATVRVGAHGIDVGGDCDYVAEVIQDPQARVKPHLVRVVRRMLQARNTLVRRSDDPNAVIVHKLIRELNSLADGDANIPLMPKLSEPTVRPGGAVTARAEGAGARAFARAPPSPAVVYSVYAVARGRATGIFQDWATTKAHTDGIPNSLFLKLKGATQAEATRAGEQWLAAQTKAVMRPPAQPTATELGLQRQLAAMAAEKSAVDAKLAASREQVLSREGQLAQMRVLMHQGASAAGGAAPSHASPPPAEGATNHSDYAELHGLDYPQMCETLSPAKLHGATASRVRKQARAVAYQLLVNRDWRFAKTTGAAFSGHQYADAEARRITAHMCGEHASLPDVLAFVCSGVETVRAGAVAVHRNSEWVIPSAPKTHAGKGNSRSVTPPARPAKPPAHVSKHPQRMPPEPQAPAPRAHATAPVAGMPGRPLAARSPGKVMEPTRAELEAGLAAQNPVQSGGVAKPVSALGGPAVTAEWAVYSGADYATMCAGLSKAALGGLSEDQCQALVKRVLYTVVRGGSRENGPQAKACVLAMCAHAEELCAKESAQALCGTPDSVTERLIDIAVSGMQAIRRHAEDVMKVGGRLEQQPGVAMITQDSTGGGEASGTTVADCGHALPDQQFGAAKWHLEHMVISARLAVSMRSSVPPCSGGWATVAYWNAFNWTPSTAPSVPPAWSAAEPVLGLRGAALDAVYTEVLLEGVLCAIDRADELSPTGLTLQLTGAVLDQQLAKSLVTADGPMAVEAVWSELAASPSPADLVNIDRRDVIDNLARRIRNQLDAVPGRHGVMLIWGVRPVRIEGKPAALAADRAAMVFEAQPEDASGRKITDEAVTAGAAEAGAKALVHAMRAHARPALKLFFEHHIAASLLSTTLPDHSTYSAWLDKREPNGELRQALAALEQAFRSVLGRVAPAWKRHYCAETAKDVAELRSRTWQIQGADAAAAARVICDNAGAQACAHLLVATDKARVSHVSDASQRALQAFAQAEECSNKAFLYADELAEVKTTARRAASLTMNASTVAIPPRFPSLQRVVTKYGWNSAAAARIWELATDVLATRKCTTDVLPVATCDVLDRTQPGADEAADPVLARWRASLTMPRGLPITADVEANLAQFDISEGMAAQARIDVNRAVAARDKSKARAEAARTSLANCTGPNRSAPASSAQKTAAQAVVTSTSAAVLNTRLMAEATTGLLTALRSGPLSGAALLSLPRAASASWLGSSPLPERQQAMPLQARAHKQQAAGAGTKPAAAAACAPAAAAVAQAADAQAERATADSARGAAEEAATAAAEATELLAATCESCLRLNNGSLAAMFQRVHGTVEQPSLCQCDEGAPAHAGPPPPAVELCTDAMVLEVGDMIVLVHARSTKLKYWLARVRLKPTRTSRGLELTWYGDATYDRSGGAAFKCGAVNDEPISRDTVLARVGRGQRGNMRRFLVPAASHAWLQIAGEAERLAQAAAAAAEVTATTVTSGAAVAGPGTRDAKPAVTAEVVTALAREMYTRCHAQAETRGMRAGEYARFLRLAGIWGSGHYTKKTWGARWPVECEALHTDVERGIDLDAFCVLYADYRTQNLHTDHDALLKALSGATTESGEDATPLPLDANGERLTRRVTDGERASAARAATVANEVAALVRSGLGLSQMMHVCGDGSCWIYAVLVYLGLLQHQVANARPTQPTTSDQAWDERVRYLVRHTSIPNGVSAEMAADHPDLILTCPQYDDNGAFVSGGEWSKGGYWMRLVAGLRSTIIIWGDGVHHAVYEYKAEGHPDQNGLIDGSQVAQSSSKTASAIKALCTAEGAGDFVHVYYNGSDHYDGFTCAQGAARGKLMSSRRSDKPVDNAIFAAVWNTQDGDTGEPMQLSLEGASGGVANVAGDGEGEGQPDGAVAAAAPPAGPEAVPVRVYRNGAVIHVVMCTEHDTGETLWADVCVHVEDDAGVPLNSYDLLLEDRSILGNHERVLQRTDESNLDCAVWLELPVESGGANLPPDSQELAGGTLGGTPTPVPVNEVTHRPFAVHEVPRRPAVTHFTSDAPCTVPDAAGGVTVGHGIEATMSSGAWGAEASAAQQAASTAAALAAAGAQAQTISRPRALAQAAPAGGPKAVPLDRSGLWPGQPAGARIQTSLVLAKSCYVRGCNAARSSCGGHLCDACLLAAGIAIQTSLIDNAGLGLFAARAFDAVEVITLYMGPPSTAPGEYVMQDRDGFRLDAVSADSCAGRFVNHSDEPNAEIGGTVVGAHGEKCIEIIASHRVEAGEEITIHYNDDYVTDFKRRSQSAPRSPGATQTATLAAGALSGEAPAHAVATAMARAPTRADILRGAEHFLLHGTDGGWCPCEPMLGSMMDALVDLPADAGFAVAAMSSVEAWTGQVSSAQVNALHQPAMEAVARALLGVDVLSQLAGTHGALAFGALSQASRAQWEEYSPIEAARAVCGGLDTLELSDTCAALCGPDVRAALHAVLFQPQAAAVVPFAVIVPTDSNGVAGPMFVLVDRVRRAHGEVARIVLSGCSGVLLPHAGLTWPPLCPCGTDAAGSADCLAALMLLVTQTVAEGINMGVVITSRPAASVVQREVPPAPTLADEALTPATAARRTASVVMAQAASQAAAQTQALALAQSQELAQALAREQAQGQAQMLEQAQVQEAAKSVEYFRTGNFVARAGMALEQEAAAMEEANIVLQLGPPSYDSDEASTEAGAVTAVVNALAMEVARAAEEDALSLEGSLAAAAEEQARLEAHERGLAEEAAAAAASQTAAEAAAIASEVDEDTCLACGGVCSDDMIDAAREQGMCMDAHGQVILCQCASIEAALVDVEQAREVEADMCLACGGINSGNMSGAARAQGMCLDAEGQLMYCFCDDSSEEGAAAAAAPHGQRADARQRQAQQAREGLRLPGVPLSQPASSMAASQAAAVPAAVAVAEDGGGNQLPYYSSHFNVNYSEMAATLTTSAMGSMSDEEQLRHVGTALYSVICDEHDEDVAKHIVDAMTAAAERLSAADETTGPVSLLSNLVHSGRSEVLRWAATTLESMEGGGPPAELHAPTAPPQAGAENPTVRVWAVFPPTGEYAPATVTDVDGEVATLRWDSGDDRHRRFAMSALRAEPPVGAQPTALAATDAPASAADRGDERDVAVNARSRVGVCVTAHLLATAMFCPVGAALTNLLDYILSRDDEEVQAVLALETEVLVLASSDEECEASQGQRAHGIVVVDAALAATDVPTHLARAHSAALVTASADTTGAMADAICEGRDTVRRGVATGDVGAAAGLSSVAVVVAQLLRRTVLQPDKVEGVPFMLITLDDPEDFSCAMMIDLVRLEDQVACRIMQSTGTGMPEFLQLVVVESTEGDSEDEQATSLAGSVVRTLSDINPAWKRGVVCVSRPMAAAKHDRHEVPTLSKAQRTAVLTASESPQRPGQQQERQRRRVVQEATEARMQQYSVAAEAHRVMLSSTPSPPAMGAGAARAVQSGGVRIEQGSGRGQWAAQEQGGESMPDEGADSEWL